MEGEGKAEVSLGGSAAPARKWQRSSITEEQARAPRAGAPTNPSFGKPGVPRDHPLPSPNLATLGQPNSCAHGGVAVAFGTATKSGLLGA